METRKRTATIPLEEYEDLVKFKESVLEKMYYEYRSYSGGDRPDRSFYYYFNDEKTREEFGEYKKQISELKIKIWELREDIRKALGSRSFRKILIRSNKYGN